MLTFNCVNLAPLYHLFCLTSRLKVWTRPTARLLLYWITSTSWRQRTVVKTVSGGSWWKWPGGLRNFISGWTYRIDALPLAIYNGVSSHSSSPKLIKLVIFSCPYWYIENIHFSLIKPNPNPKHEHKRINPTGHIKSMTHNKCHQSCKGKSRTQDHSHTKLGTFRSTTKVLLLIGQSLAFYSNRVMAADLGYSHFLWAFTFIMFFQMKFKFSKKQFMILYKIWFFNWFVILFQ